MAQLLRDCDRMKKPRPIAGALFVHSERERFELSRRSSRLPAFEAGAFNHSTTSPWDVATKDRRFAAAGEILAFLTYCLRLRKNACSCAAASSPRTPAVTSMR